MDTPRRVAHLEQGVIEYVDTGGPGRPLVLLHGALMDDGLWHQVIDDLPDRLRCIVPVLPMGAHTRPMPSHADLSPRGIAKIVGNLIEHLDVTDAVLVGNDTGGAIAQLLVASRPDLAAGLVLVSSDAYDNFPPGLPGRVMALACAVPGGLRAAMSTMRWRPMRRLPFTFGWMTRRPIDDAVFVRWLDAHAADRGVRRDVRRMMAGVDRVQLIEAAEHLADYEGSALVVWAAADRIMPRAHAERLTATLPHARLELVPDSYTLVPLDQPGLLADLLARFVVEASTSTEVHQ